MRLALLILALMAAPALARDLPPEEPTYEKPSFEKPERPTPPTPPNNEEREREVRTFTPKPVPVSCPKVKCVTDENGHRRAMFTADVTPDMYYLGRNFCKKVPKHITEVTACCFENDGDYQIRYDVAVPTKAHKKAEQFCACVLGLD